MKEECKERRRSPRVVVRGQVESKLRPEIVTTFIDLSLTGALIEHPSLIRTGDLYELLITTAGRELCLKARAVRTAVHHSGKSKTGELELIYHTGLEFVDVRQEEQEQLAAVIRSL
ncbi:MAG: PilZ domain-containing protein [Candidatus Methylomirabilales bacterium]